MKKRIYGMSIILSMVSFWGLYAIDFTKQLIDAAWDGNLNLVQKLVTPGANTNVQDNKGLTPLHYAVVLGHLNVVKWFVGHGANFNIKENTGFTPLHMAVINGRLNVVEWLVSHGASINLKDNDGMTPLHHNVINLR